MQLNSGPFRVRDLCVWVGGSVTPQDFSVGKFLKIEHLFFHINSFTQLRDGPGYIIFSEIYKFYAFIKKKRQVSSM